MKVLPTDAGVYQICCLPTGKIYVGSAINLRVRWGQHRRSLRRGVHRNPHLQNAWDKYGEASFAFTILEVMLPTNRLQAEQAWIDKTACTNKEIGFNIFEIAGSPGTVFAQTWEGFVDPEGNEMTITNLHEFCRSNALDYPSMHRLARGKSKLKSYKGWTHKNSQRQRDYVKTYDGFVTPDGCRAEPITNLAAFCRDHGLDNTHMVAVARGRIHSHRGWTYNDGKPNSAHLGAHTGFIDPGGQPTTITNLTAFCREYRLSVTHMHGLKSGKRLSHKGWKWSPPGE